MGSASAEHLSRPAEAGPTKSFHQTCSSRHPPLLGCGFGFSRTDSRPTEVGPTTSSRWSCQAHAIAVLAVGSALAEQADSFCAARVQRAPTHSLTHSLAYSA